MPKIDWIDENWAELARQTPIAWATITSMGGPNDEPTWKPFRHMRVIDERLRNLADDSHPLKKLIICLPRQSGKSEISSIAFPTWYLGHNPTHRIGVLSYGADRAVEFGSRARDKFETWGESIFGLKVDQRTNSKKRWSILGYKGGMISFSIKGSLNGERINCLILDDLFKDEAQAASRHYREFVWKRLTSTIMPALTKNGTMLVINTRWHASDIVGELLRSEYDNSLVLGTDIPDKAIAPPAYDA